LNWTGRELRNCCGRERRRRKEEIEESGVPSLPLDSPNKVGWMGWGQGRWKVATVVVVVDVTLKFSPSFERAGGGGNQPQPQHHALGLRLAGSFGRAGGAPSRDVEGDKVRGGRRVD